MFILRKAKQQDNSITGVGADDGRNGRSLGTRRSVGRVSADVAGVRRCRVKPCRSPAVSRALCASYDMNESIAAVACRPASAAQLAAAGGLQVGVVRALQSEASPRGTTLCYPH
jgi:hypothetical protein